MDCWEEFSEKLMEKIQEQIHNKYDDDVFEFNLRVSDVIDVTEAVGEDEEGARAFSGVEITD